MIAPPASLAARLCAFVLLAAVIASQGSALAEGRRGASESETSLARKQFSAGVAAASADDWAGALSAFQRSYALYPHPETLINIAGAQRRLGKLVAASEAYQRYLRTADPHSTSNRRVAEQALHELQAQVAHVVLTVRQLAVTDVVTLDGEALARATLGLALPIDPGAHTLVVRRAHRELVRREFRAVPSARLEVTLDVPPSVRSLLADPNVVSEHAAPRAPTLALHKAEKEREPGQPLRRKWWLWTSVGAVVAGGVVAGFLLRPEDGKTYKGDYNGDI